MKISIEMKGLFFAMLGSLSALGTVCGTCAVMQSGKPALVKRNLPTAQPNAVHAGSVLYAQSCAHCHGDDARGDEGPDLHGVKKSDARMANIILHGIKGEMPQFGKKFGDPEVHALIAFLHSLKE